MPHNYLTLYPYRYRSVIPGQVLKGDLNIVFQRLELLGVTANLVVPVDQSWAQLLQTV